MALGKNYVVSKVARLKVCHWFLMVSQRMLPFYQIFRIVKAHKEILFKFFFYHFFSRPSLWRNHFMFEKSMYFPVIPDNSHDLLRTSGSYVFYEIIFWRHGSMNHVSSIIPVESRRRGRDSAYWKGGDARRLAYGCKFRILGSRRVCWTKRHHF